MNRPISSRRRARAIAVAVAAAMAMGGRGANHADAALLIDVRALPGSGYSTTGKTFTLTGGGAVTLSLGVFARISGTNAVQQIGDFDGDGLADDTRNDDTVLNVVGGFQSVGGILGNLTLGAAGASISPDPRVAPFAGPGSANGVAGDWDTDGDLDIGATGTDASKMWSARAAFPVHATIFGGPTPTNGWSDDAGNFGVNTRDTIIDPTTAEVQLGSLRFVSSLGGGPTVAINFVPRPVTDAGGALWFEDGISIGKTPGTGAYLLGAPVTTFTPEPVPTALLSVAALGLLARRRARL